MIDTIPNIIIRKPIRNSARLRWAAVNRPSILDPIKVSVAKREYIGPEVCPVHMLPPPPPQVEPRAAGNELTAENARITLPRVK